MLATGDIAQHQRGQVRVARHACPPGKCTPDQVALHRYAVVYLTGARSAGAGTSNVYLPDSAKTGHVDEHANRQAYEVAGGDAGSAFAREAIHGMPAKVDADTLPTDPELRARWLTGFAAGVAGYVGAIVFDAD